MHLSNCRRVDDLAKTTAQNIFVMTTTPTSTFATPTFVINGHGFYSIGAIHKFAREPLCRMWV
jgi:hypothetical protein